MRFRWWGYSLSYGNEKCVSSVVPGVFDLCVSKS